MIRSLLLLTVIASIAGCGDNHAPGIDYSNPKGGKLRLIKSKTKPASENEVVLDLVVGDQALTGYSVGFNLPVGHRLVRLSDFVPGTALEPGSSPPAARAVQPASGPLADMLVTGLSQKASGPDAVATDTTLAPGSVLYTIRLQKVIGAPEGVVFDGTDASFVLPSGGMRDRSGTTVVEAADVAIGKLEINE
ncbi:MAG TPA: hypothetical protein VIV40_11530 [Kofleriaceae bacterium]